MASCPGSGKTRTIIAKVQRCIDEVRETPRKIACITFTNAAVNEIEARLRLYGDRADNESCEVSTIHSFCLNYILRPFAHLDSRLQKDWSVLTTDDEWYIALVKQLMTKYRIKASLVDRFDGLQRRYPDKLPTDSGLPQGAVKEFFERADAEGRVTLGDIVFYSANIVKNNSFIASALASRFAWFIVDEFQDTTVAQAIILYEVFKLGRSKLFFVGDPNQAILGFAGGSPELMNHFAKIVNANTEYHLTGNFRSSALIVRHAELLCRSNPGMEAIGEHKNFHFSPTYTHCSTPIEGIFDHFLPTLDFLSIPLGKAAVLAPWWTDLLLLGRELRKRGIPIIGPGSRPYKRSHAFSLLSEALSGYLVAQDADSAAAIQKSLFITLSSVTDVRIYDIYRYNGRRIVFRLISAAREILKHNESIQEWLLQCAEVCERILAEEELLNSVDEGVFTKSASAMLEEMVKNGVDVANMAAVELGMLVVPANCLNLITMHQSKGREFDAVAVICVHEGRVPHFKSTTQREFDEAQRLLYVAATRAKKVLMYFTDETNYKNSPSRFLKSPYLSMC